MSYKTSIVVIVKSGKTTLSNFDSPDEADAAYVKARDDEGNDFVGFLRKPTWYKRSTPKTSAENIKKEKEAVAKRQEEQEARQAELDLKRAKEVLEAAQKVHDSLVAKPAPASKKKKAVKKKEAEPASE